MSFRGFLDAIKAQSATAPEEADDEESKDGKPKDDKLTLKLEMQYKFKIPEFCTTVKK